MTTLDQNLTALQQATGEVRFEGGRERFDTQQRSASVHRFFHLLLLECCEHMTAREFRQAIDAAREQLRKPL